MRLRFSPFFIADFNYCTKPRKHERAGCLGFIIRVKWDRRHEWDIAVIEADPLFKFRWDVTGKCKHCGIREQHTAASEADMLAAGISIPGGTDA